MPSQQDTPSKNVLETAKSALYEFYEWATPETRCDLSSPVRPAGSCSNPKCDTSTADRGTCGPAMGFIALPSNAPDPSDRAWDPVAASPGLGCNFGLYAPPADMAAGGFGLRSFNSTEPRPRGAIGADGASAPDTDAFKYLTCFDPSEDGPGQALFAGWYATSGPGGLPASTKQLCIAMAQGPVTAPRNASAAAGIHARTSYSFDKCFQLWNRFDTGGRNTQRHVRYEQKLRDVDKCFTADEMDLSVKVDIGGAAAATTTKMAKAMPVTETDFMVVGLDSGADFVNLIEEVRGALVRDPALVGGAADKVGVSL